MYTKWLNYIGTAQEERKQTPSAWETEVSGRGGGGWWCWEEPQALERYWESQRKLRVGGGVKSAGKS